MLKPLPGQPGAVMDDATGKKFRVSNEQRKVLYDTETQAAGAITANTEIRFFDDLANKKKLDNNTQNQRRIPAGTVFEMERVGLRVSACTGSLVATGSDIKKTLECGYLRFEVNSILVTDGPGVHYPAGFGVTGSTVEAGAAVVTNGVAGATAHLPLVSPITLNDQYDLNPTYTFHDRLWDANIVMPTLDQRVEMRFEMYGRLFSAATL